MIISLLNKLQYYLGATYRRKILDKELNTNKNYFTGKVLDIGGGRKRGNFQPPKVSKWIFADITSELKPDVICDVEKMQFDDNSFETIKATELFEHVARPVNGIEECYRVLKDNGYFVVSAPFIYPVHGDPYDYQRWTEYKWTKTLKDAGFKIEKIIKVGLFFTVLSDMLKFLNKALPLPLRLLGYLFYPLLDILSAFDNTVFIKKHSKFNSYATGYLFIAKK
jgi:SAM-dependent methyltransferase